MSSLLLHWLHSNLTNRSQHVGKGVWLCLLSTSCLFWSTAQGSNLGPILFTLYINDLTKLLLSPSPFLTLYNDNILLYYSIVSFHCLRQIYLDLDTISTWFPSRFFSINTNKSKYIIATCKPQCYFPCNCIIIIFCFSLFLIGLNYSNSWLTTS